MIIMIITTTKLTPPSFFILGVIHQSIITWKAQYEPRIYSLLLCSSVLGKQATDGLLSSPRCCLITKEMALSLLFSNLSHTEKQNLMTTSHSPISLTSRTKKSYLRVHGKVDRLGRASAGKGKPLRGASFK